MRFSAQLKKYRKASELSQEDLAEKLGITRQAISKWESDQSVPDVDTCLHLCEIFRITPNQLLLEKQTDAIIQNNEKASVKKDRYRFFTLFHIATLLCGTALLIINLYNGKTFEPFIHMLSMVMIAGSVVAFVCGSIVWTVKKEK